LVFRGFKPALLLASLAGSLAIAAPAAADAPSGSDFTQALPATTQLRPAPARAVDGNSGYGDHGPVLYRSAPAVAPKRFDLVGVAGEMHALEFRTKRDGKPWTKWVETDNGDPVWAGGADRVQVRSRGVPIEGHLHYVRIDQGSVPASKLLARGGGGLQAPAAAAASARPRRLPKEPHFITRAQWGANAKVGGCPPREAPDLARIKAGVIHHTVSTNTYTEAQAPGLVLGICRYHRNSNGWNDIGYNALVDRFGNLYEGRAGGLSRPILGAQAEGVNSYTFGIASIGDNRETPASAPERKSITKFIAWKFGLAGIDDAEGRTTLLSAGGETQKTPDGQRVRTPRIFSHNFTNYTACAGDALIAQIPQIRRAVQRKLGSAGATPPKSGGSHGGHGGGNGGGVSPRG
jgi:uncharacterized protein with LGFP repeats